MKKVTGDHIPLRAETIRSRSELRKKDSSFSYISN